ncbi:MAG: sodium:solute symporter family protein [Gemmatimonadota bacterium]|nr:MAG: sodium:solute symporter family protein [Gemmatimonadota bacterium]
MERWVTVTLVTAGYLALSLLVGWISGRRASDTVTGYVAGDRGFGLLVMYFVTGAMMFSAFAFLGTPGWAYSRGAAAFYVFSYGLLGFAPWYFLGPMVARVGRVYGHVTQAELLSHRFQSTTLSVLIAIVSIIAFVPYIALQMKGAGIVFNAVTDGNVPIWVGALAAYAVVLLYVLKSGVLGVGWTNTFQGIFMLIIAWVLGLWLPNHLYGGVGAMFERIAELRPELLTAPGLDANATGSWGWGAYSSAILVSAIGVTMWPHLFMKGFAAKDDETIKLTMVLYPTFLLFLLPLYFIAFAGVLFESKPPSADFILPHMILSTNVAPVVVGLFCAGALAASMSTGDAMLHASASIYVQDMHRRVFDRKLSDHGRRRLIRIVAVIVGVASYYTAVNTEMSLVALLLAAYGAIVQLAPITAAAFFWKRATAAGAVTGLVLGSLVTLLLFQFPQLRPFGLHEGIVGLATNCLALVVVSLATRPLEGQHVDSFIDASRSAV